MPAVLLLKKSASATEVTLSSYTISETYLAARDAKGATPLATCVLISVIGGNQW